MADLRTVEEKIIDGQEKDIEVLKSACEAARSWMAHNAGGTEWANRVRSQLNAALGKCGECSDGSCAISYPHKHE